MEQHVVELKIGASDPGPVRVVRGTPRHTDERPDAEAIAELRRLSAALGLELIYEPE